jgi:two-component system, response regulator
VAEEELFWRAICLHRSTHLLDVLFTLAVHSQSRAASRKFRPCEKLNPSDGQRVTLRKRSAKRGPAPKSGFSRFVELIHRNLECRVQTNLKMDGGNGSNVEILLIEDNPEHISSAQGILQKANICNAFKVVQTAAEAFDWLFRTGTYAKELPLSPETLILLSLSLRSMHGLDLLRKLRNDERTKLLPVIMLSSSQEERGVMQSYKLGASGCIVKPIDLQKFVEAVAELRLGWLLLPPA